MELWILNRVRLRRIDIAKTSAKIAAQSKDVREVPRFQMLLRVGELNARINVAKAGRQTSPNRRKRISRKRSVGVQQHHELVRAIVVRALVPDRLNDLLGNVDVNGLMSWRDANVLDCHTLGSQVCKQER